MESRIAEKIELKKTASKRRQRLVGLWAKIPLALRLVAGGALLFTIFVVGASYWQSRNNQDFRLKGQTPELSTEVIAVVNGYERRVTNGDKLVLLIRADRETTYADQRHELDNIYLENYAENSATPDRISAVKAVYTPDAAQPENFIVNFSGNVNFESRDNLKVNTEQISYDKTKDYAETAALINFSRENLSGNAIGAKIFNREQKLTLENQVAINIAPNGKLGKNSLTDFGNSNVTVNAGRADFDQNLEKLELQTGVNISIVPQNSENLPTTIRAEKIVYRKDSQQLDLTGGVEIVSASDNVGVANGKNQTAIPVTIRADAATYEQADGKINLNGAASVRQANELMNGDQIRAVINPQKKIETATARGNAFLRTISAERTTEINGGEIVFNFDKNQQIQFARASGGVKIKSQSGENYLELNDAEALDLNFKIAKTQSLLEKMTTTGNTNVVLTASNSADYSRVSLASPNSTQVLFTTGDDRSVLNQMTTGGRTTITIAAPNSQTNNASATNKKIVSDTLKLSWNQGGKDLKNVEAVGNAELYIMPLGAGASIDKQTLTAARFDCDFYENGNLARNFTANGKARAVLEPTQPNAANGVKNLTAEKITTLFERNSQVGNFNANGNAKFQELDRTATANNLIYTASDETLRLRGGEPLIWDSSARLKAAEIDWNTRTQISNSRGKVATTYYSQEKTGGATPFAKPNAPVFVVSNTAEFNHSTGVAVYNGNSRAWQDENFIRSDRLTLRRDDKSMLGEGAVQSSLYNAKRRENGKDAVVPVFATAARVTYSDAGRILRYDGNVEIKQAAERITGGSAEVFLNARNDLEKTIAQNNVVITQPGRTARGDWAQFTPLDETVILRGNPATVEDQQNGLSQGRQLTVNLRENRVQNQGGATPTAPGRIRSTHKIRKQ